MNRYSLALSAMALGVCMATVSACGDDGGKKSGPESFVGETGHALISVEEGGKLELGAVKISVPEGAVDKQVRITAEVHNKKDYPQSNKVALDVYEFGPKGTTFSKDVELEFDLKGLSSDKRSRAKVAELDEEAGQWKVLPSSKAASGKVRATTKHFSYYTVFLAEATAETPDEVPLCDADYTPCGGDLTGTWAFESGCISYFSGLSQVPNASAGGALCADTNYEVIVTVGGTASFGPETYGIDQTINVDSSYRISVACLAEIERLSGQPYGCPEFGGEVAGEFCEVNSSSGEVPVSSEGTYEASDGSLTLTTEQGYVMVGYGLIDPPITDYCVRGDTLTLRFKGEEDTSAQVYVARRVQE